MKKFLVYGLAVLWLAAVLQFIWQGGKEEDRIVEAFQQTALTEERCVLQFQGRYDGWAPSGEAREALFIEIAQALGIRDGYTLGWYEAEEQESLIFQKEGKYGDTQMVWTVLSEREEVYEGAIEAVSVQITLHSAEQVLAWQKRLQAACEEAGFSGRTDFCLTGVYAGNMELEARNEAAEQILSDMGAGSISGSRTMELYSLYGYTEKIDHSLYTGGREVNLNLVMYYDEGRDQTVISVGSPIVKNDF